MHLTIEQRYTIASMKQLGCSNNSIALAIERDKSVVSRELKRNRDLRSNEYRADTAQRKYIAKMKSKPHYYKLNSTVKELINLKLKENLSPEQIAGVCKKDEIVMVSHETIYKYIWQDKKKGGELYINLRTQGKKYKSRSLKTDKRGQIVGRKDIKTRPPIVEERIRLGDLEIDTIIGKDHKGAILTINDRATGMVWIKKLEGKDANALARETIVILDDYKPYLKTITSDNGKEFAQHKQIENELNVDFYFAEPYCFGKEEAMKIITN